jgi:hypothetical protein
MLKKHYTITKPIIPTPDRSLLKPFAGPNGIDVEEWLGGENIFVQEVLPIFKSYAMLVDIRKNAHLKPTMPIQLAPQSAFIKLRNSLLKTKEGKEQKDKNEGEDVFTSQPNEFEEVDETGAATEKKDDFETIIVIGPNKVKTLRGLRQPKGEELEIISNIVKAPCGGDTPTKEPLYLTFLKEKENPALASSGASLETKINSLLPVVKRNYKRKLDINETADKGKKKDTPQESVLSSLLSITSPVVNKKRVRFDEDEKDDNQKDEGINNNANANKQLEDIEKEKEGEKEKDKRKRKSIKKNEKEKEKDEGEEDFLKLFN